MRRPRLMTVVAIRFFVGSGIAVLAFLTTGAHAQDDPTVGGVSNRAFSIVPSVSVSETRTNNARLAGGTQSGHSDLITQVSPSLQMTSNGPRVKGYFDYAATGLLYARNSGSNEVQNSLNAAVKVEAIEDWAFLDSTANISQQVISAFGTQSADPALVNSNRTEVRSFSLSPYIRGALGSIANYDARFTHASTRSASDAVSDHSTSQASLRIGSISDLRVLGWSVDATRQVYDFQEGRRTVDDRLRGILYVSPDPQVRLSLIAGHESNDIVTPDKQSQRTWGAGIDWMPSERTRLSAQRERRFFGNAHALSFEHRTPRSVWKYTDSRDITTGLGQSSPGRFGTAYDLFFTQFASLQPDPVLRATLVDSFLTANGIAPATQVFAGSLASAATVQRRQELSFALLGVRDTVTFIASQTDGRRIDRVVAVVDDFADGNVLRQRGASVDLAHRLTPLSALNLVATFARITGTSASQSTTLRSISLAWSGRVGPRSSYVLSTRHSRFSSPTDPYSESAMTATLSLRF
jgi:uncharacterized protein (PEP-CTERM system associated)